MGLEATQLALEAAEKWLREPTVQNRRLVVEAENRVWRSKDWTNREGSAAEACGYAARTACHPQTSAMQAIWCEAYANNVTRGEYSRKWLLLSPAPKCESPMCDKSGGKC